MNLVVWAPSLLVDRVIFCRRGVSWVGYTLSGVFPTFKTFGTRLFLPCCVYRFILTCCCSYALLMKPAGAAGADKAAGYKTVAIRLLANAHYLNDFHGGPIVI